MITMIEGTALERLNNLFKEGQNRLYQVSFYLDNEVDIENLKKTIEQLSHLADFYAQGVNKELPNFSKEILYSISADTMGHISIDDMFQSRLYSEYRQHAKSKPDYSRAFLFKATLLNMIKYWPSAVLREEGQDWHILVKTLLEEAPLEDIKKLNLNNQKFFSEEMEKVVINQLRKSFGNIIDF